MPPTPGPPPVPPVPGEPAYTQERIASLLATRRFGRTLRFLDVTPSTQRVAMELAASGAPEGALVLAQEQTAGVGRRGRSWHSARGLGIWLSLVLRPPVPSSRCLALSTWAGLAVLDTLRARRLDGGAAGLKWPNDIVAGGRKLGGMLIDARGSGRELSYAVLGLGLNTGHGESDFPEELAGAATSVRMITGEAPDRAALLADLLLELERGYGRALSEDGSAELAARAGRASVLMGRRVRVSGEGVDIEGEALRVDADGALVVKDGRTGGEVRVTAADVEAVETREEKA
jgi:BirA family biotin operon repressor/biotin-[acetyl-CoA-carboxylase] ligase